MKAIIYSLGVFLTLAVSTNFLHGQSFEAERDRGSVIAEPDGQDGAVVSEPSQHSSVVVMISENGLEVFSPGADPSLGNGEKLLTEPIEHDRRLGDGHYDTKPHGGIRLFGWFF